MLAPAIPSDETERLADLHALAILDTPSEERFNRIVRLARAIFDVPIAYIALVDSDRQWFKAKCGLTSDETGRDVSFCGHAILQDEPLIVPDALEDERFVDNPLVTGEPFVRFYAGHPLAGPAGKNIGTLCLVDREPRTLSDRELEMFENLAMVAEREIGLVDLIRTQQELLEARAALAVTQARLTRELADAAAFVRSVVPAPVVTASVTSAHRLIACSELGGDMLGAMPLDSTGRRTALYLFDVSGHGVGASLLSVAVGNILRNQSLPGVDFTRPGDVLTALNASFPIDRTDGKFFTAWYGVYDATDRTLCYASAGHHPALLAPPSGPVRELGGTGPLIGFFPDAEFAEERAQVHPGSLIYLFSDGGFEVSGLDGAMLGYEAFSEIVAGVARELGDEPADDRLEAIVAQVMEHADGTLDDDFGLLEAAFC
jgi:sigma-B regulation protein RsbU (phosphoserine phosphatase)